MAGYGDWPIRPSTLREKRHLCTTWLAARRAIKDAKCVSDSKAEAEAHRAVDRAKQASGERGPIWWEDGAPDLNRQIVKNTPYTTWYAREVQGRRVLKRA